MRRQYKFLLVMSFIALSSFNIFKPRQKTKLYLIGGSTVCNGTYGRADPYQLIK